MAIIQRTIRSIPLEQLINVDQLFFKQIQMDGDKVLKKFKGFYEETRERTYAQLEGKCLYSSFKIEKIENNIIYLEQGVEITNVTLSRVFEKSDELVICAITMEGYEALDVEPDNFMNTLFFDGWGTALVECGYAWLKKQIAEELHGDGLYATSAWSPGQHNVDIQLQHMVFDLIHPEDIGITLNNSCLMHPKKSITGIFGIGREEDVEQMRPCDFCEHRETCPNAYV